MTMGTTAAESMNASANIFLGQSEAPLMIRPYLKVIVKHLPPHHISDICYAQKPHDQTLPQGDCETFATPIIYRIFATPKNFMIRPYLKVP